MVVKCPVGIFPTISSSYCDVIELDAEVFHLAADVVDVPEDQLAVPPAAGHNAHLPSLHTVHAQLVHLQD